MGTETLAAEAEKQKDQELVAIQHVTFMVGDEIFAVAMQPLNEIVRLPKVIQVPLSASCLEGLINLRGQVLPIVNLRKVFGFETRPHNDATRVLVVNVGRPVGFLVDQVSKIINVSPEQVESCEVIKSSVKSSYLHGVIKNAGENEMVMLLNFEEILKQDLASISWTAGKGTKKARGKSRVEEAEQATELEQEQQLVSFAIEDQEYAVKIEHVKEIVQAPEHIIHVPQAAKHVLGLTVLRNQVLPLVSLRQMFDLDAEQALSEHQRVVVVAFEVNGETLRVGLATDAVNEVLRVMTKQIEEVPALLQRDQKTAEIKAICRLDHGKRIVSILSVEKMFAHEMVSEAIEAAKKMQEELPMTEQHEETESLEEEQQFVIFRLMDDEYGVPIQAVKEIVRVPEQLTHIPKAPKFIEGIINLRGAVLPVVDERLRLDLPRMEANDRQRIIVLLINDIRTGFIVDSVSEVLMIASGDIKDVPELSADNKYLVPRVANLEEQGRMIMLINIEQLLEINEAKALKKVVKAVDSGDD